MVLPTAAELAANPAQVAATGQGWYGCVLGRQCLASGPQGDLLSGVASAEACCRACSERYEGSTGAVKAGTPCNAWNFCGSPGGCAYDTAEATLTLKQGQCAGWGAGRGAHAAAPALLRAAWACRWARAPPACLNRVAPRSHPSAGELKFQELATQYVGLPMFVTGARGLCQETGGHVMHRHSVAVVRRVGAALQAASATEPP